MIKIIPAILSNNSDEVNNFLNEAQNVAKRVQIDIIDGQFTSGKTIDPVALSQIEVSFELDYHLMVKEPINWVEKCVTGQADRIIGQIEMMSDQIEFVKKVQSVGLGVGLALDVETDLSNISDDVLESLDVLLIMSRKAGFGAFTFELSTFDKIKEVVVKRETLSHKFKICIDGGVTDELIVDLVKVNVDEVAVGRKIFDGDLGKNMKELADY